MWPKLHDLYQIIRVHTIYYVISFLQAKQIFESLCPNEEFLPAVPNPEDIIMEDFLQTGEQTGDNGNVDTENTEGEAAAVSSADAQSTTSQEPDEQNDVKEAPDDTETPQSEDATVDSSDAQQCNAANDILT